MVETRGKSHRSVGTFMLILLLSSIPFWILGFVVGSLPLPINLPISALMAFNPLLAAVILIYRAEGMDGVKALLKRLVDYKRIQPKIWFVPAFLFMPAVLVLEYIIMRLLGTPLPDAPISILSIPAFFALFFIGAIGEEAGWQGYVYEPLATRWNALGAALIIGVIWAVWHSIPYIQTHNTAWWIFWQSAVTVGLRVVIVWLYNNGHKSVLLAVIFHTMINVSEFLFPVYGSHYDPFIATVIVTLAVAGIVGVWGGKTLRSG